MADKTLMEKIQQGRQYRNIKEIRAIAQADDSNEKIVEGYATTFNEPYVLYSGEGFEIREQIDSHAFDDADTSDVIMQYDHQGRVFARLSNHTLSLSKDEHGLKIRANLGGTTTGCELYEEIKGGYTNKMSFGFTINEEDCLETREGDKDVYLYTVKKIGKLYDVSAVSLPANDGTEISARSLVDGVIAKRTQDVEDKKKADELKLEEERKAKEKEERERLALDLSLSMTL